MMGFGNFDGYDYGYGYGCGMNGGWGHILGVLVVILVVVFIVALIRRNRKSGHYGCWGGMCSLCSDGNKALDLLKERYVKGEIDRAEFEQKKKDLSN